MSDLQLPDLGLTTKDMSVYILIEMVNAVLSGQDLTIVHREKLAQFPYSLKLLDHMAAKRRGGLSRFHASPGPDATVETFAKALLAVDWEIAHGHSYRISTLDHVWGWTTDARTMRKTFRVHWHRLPAWIMDRLREVRMKFRAFHNRKILGLVNPYN